MALPQCLHRTEKQREDRQGQADSMSRCSPQIIRAEHIVSHSHDCEDTRIDHRYGVQQSCHRGRRDRSRRKPVIKRKYRCFGPESYKSENKGELHHSRIIGHKDASAVAENAVHSIHSGEHYGYEAQRRSSDRVRRVLPAREHTLMSAVMGYERDRHQRQHLDEHVHRDHIRGVAHSEGHAVRHDIKGKKAIAVLVSLHVLKGVQKHQGPHDRDHDREHICHAVHAEVHRESAGETVNRNRIARCPQRCCPDAG